MSATGFSLYALTDKYRELLHGVANGTIEIDAVADTLDAIDELIELKAENIGKMIRTVEGENLAIDAEIKRLQERKQTNARTSERLKKYLEERMKLLEKDKIDTPTFKFWIQGNGHSVRVDDEKAIPKKFFVKKVDVQLDKKAILELLKEGKKIKGVSLQQTSSIRMK